MARPAVGSRRVPKTRGVTDAPGYRFKLVPWTSPKTHTWALYFHRYPIILVRRNKTQKWYLKRPLTPLEVRLPIFSKPGFHVSLTGDNRGGHIVARDLKVQIGQEDNKSEGKLALGGVQKSAAAICLSNCTG